MDTVDVNEPAAGAIKVLVKAFDDITGGNSLVVPAEHEQMFTAVFGWWGWINRSCKLSLLAHDAGLGHESTPNLRSIVEHCLVLQWVVGRRLRCDGCRRRPRRTTPTLLFGVSSSLGARTNVFPETSSTEPKETAGPPSRSSGST